MTSYIKLSVIRGVMTVVSWPTTSVSETLLCSALIKCHICHIYLSAAFFFS